MKKTLVFILIIIPLLSFSQKRKKKDNVNPCDVVALQYDEMTDVYRANIPDITNMREVIWKGKGYETMYNISLSKSVIEEINYTRVSLMGGSNVSLRGLKGLFIKLSNDEILRFTDIDIRSSYVSDYYSNYADLTLTEEIVNKLKEHKIIKFNLGNISFDITEKDSELFRKYVECLSNQNTP